jgi:hypothetical protein
MASLQSQKNQAKDAFGEDDLEGGLELSKSHPSKMLVSFPFSDPLRCAIVFVL